MLTGIYRSCPTLLSPFPRWPYTCTGEELFSDSLLEGREVLYKYPKSPYLGSSLSSAVVYSRGLVFSVQEDLKTVDSGTGSETPGLALAISRSEMATPLQPLPWVSHQTREAQLAMSDGARHWLCHLTSHLKTSVRAHSAAIHAIITYTEEKRCAHAMNTAH